MDIPEVTVLMSVYNGEKYLHEAIKSILNQAWGNFEFLILNDDSTDNTAKILSGYSDPRIRIINNERNIGLTRSLNKGLREAKGIYIARMDADDISLPDRIKIQYHCFRENPDVGVVAGWVQVIDEWCGNLGEWSTPLQPEDIYYRLNFRNCLAHGAVMFRKDVVLKSGGYNENIERAQDYELWYRLSKITKICQVDKFLLKWRDHKANISNKWKKEQEKRARRLVKPRLESLAGRKLSKDEIKRLQKNKIDNIDDLQETIRLLGKINKNLLSTEAGVIKHTGLKKRRIKKAMRLKIRKLLYMFFRPLSAGRFLRYFMNLRFRTKLTLLYEICSGLKRKISG